MDHNCIILGFFGIDKFEYILYLSRIVYHLGKKILLLDCSDAKALASCIPVPDELTNEITDSRGVNFLNIINPKIFDFEKLVATNKKFYDCIFIDFGFSAGKDQLNLCDGLILVTDQRIHNIRRLPEKQTLPDRSKILIIKDFIPCKITPRYILEEIDFGSSAKESVFLVNQDELDLKCSISCQHDNIVLFRKLSVQVTTAVKGILKEFFPEYTSKEMRRAFHMTGKGE